MPTPLFYTMRGKLLSAKSRLQSLCWCGSGGEGLRRLFFEGKSQKFGRKSGKTGDFLMAFLALETMPSYLQKSHSDQIPVVR